MRKIYEIACDIEDNWTKVAPAARPYLTAMHSLGSANDSYGFDSAHDIVARFLCNATGYRGELARAHKAELKAILGIK